MSYGQPSQLQIGTHGKKGRKKERKKERKTHHA
jgi:hypothetical protein